MTIPIRKAEPTTRTAHEPSGPGIIEPAHHWAAPALGLPCLFPLSVAIHSVKPAVTLFQIRIVLLTLIIVLTILVKTFSVVLPLAPSKEWAGGSFGTTAPPMAFLFLFSDVDLILVFLATFLPVYRRLKKRLV